MFRKFKVTKQNGDIVEVSQLQTKKWADLSAPEETKLLRHIVHKTRDVNTSTANPILVHCSAGVGRTGTFIAVYKLIEDIYDKR